MTDRELIRKKIEHIIQRRLNLLNGDVFDLTEETKGLTAEIIDSLQEESVSEELEEAAKNHAVERYRATRDMVLAEKCKWSFITGAKWQKKKDNILSEKNVSSIWHNASDPHDESKLLIVKLISGQVALYRGSFNNAQRDFGIYEAVEHGSESKGIIEKWCYFDDILPDNKQN